MWPDDETETTWARVKDWLIGLPIYLAYRIVWLCALTGHSTATAVYKAMWDAELDLPRLRKETP